MESGESTGPGVAPPGMVAAGYRAMEWLIALCLAVMVGLVFVNVVLRYVFGTGVPEGEELARLAFVWLIFLGAVLAMREHGHIGVTLVVDRMPPAARRACALFNHALILWALWLLGEGSWTVTVIGLDNRLPVTGLPAAVFSAAGVVLAVAMSAIVLGGMWRIATGGNPDGGGPGEGELVEAATSVRGRE